MFTFYRRFLYVLSNKIRRLIITDRQAEKPLEEKWIVDFAKPEKSPFDIKSESSYNAYLSNGSLALGLKKPNCIAWVEIPGREYRDHVIEAKIRLDSLGGYAAAGLLFHIVDDDSYYLALVSSKGYFRIDIVKDGSPRSLTAWTEISDFNGTDINLNIITYGTYLIFLVNGKWVGAASDDSINIGRLGFALASYEAGEGSRPDTTNEYTCKAWLDFFSVDNRTKIIEENYKKWDDGADISAESRLRLAETFAVMGEYSQALDQINKAWKQREEPAASVSAKELLLVARMSFRLGQYQEAEEFIDAILEQKIDSAEGREAVSEKIRILNELDKFAELKIFMLKHFDLIDKDIDMYALLARCHWKLNEYEESAAAWKKAYEMEKSGVYAVNAANALELVEKKDEALDLFLEAGKIFLRQDNQAELAALVPKLVLLGENNWEARALAGKWAFSIENYDRCEAEFAAAEKLRCKLKPRPQADPALCYLQGMVYHIKGKTKDAVRLLEQAVKLAPDYGLFRFKLAEVKLTSGKKEPKLAKELRIALDLMDDDPEGKTAHYAGTLLLNSGDRKNAEYFFEKAKKKTGTVSP